MVGVVVDWEFRWFRRWSSLFLSFRIVSDCFHKNWFADNSFGWFIM